MLIPFSPAVSAIVSNVARLTAKEIIAIGTTAVGVGAGLKGAIDYRKAQSVKKAALEKYHKMVALIRQRSRTVQGRLANFDRLKLETYRGIIHKAVNVLSRFRSVDLSSFNAIQIGGLEFLKTGLEPLGRSCIKASDVLSSLSAGINTFARGAHPGAGIALAGLTWGLNGNQARIKAEADAAEVTKNTERLKPTLTALQGIANRVAEGEELIVSLTGKLRSVLMDLQSVRIPDNKVIPSTIASKLQSAVSLTKALKQVIETDIVTVSGKLNDAACVIFRKIKKEYSHAA